MFKKLNYSITLFIILALFFGLHLVKAQTPVMAVCIKDICLEAEIADSAPKRTQGLMSRDGLSGNQAMFFIYQEDLRHGIWMKNMKFPLDIIWVSQDKRIVDIKADAAPCKTYCEVFIPRLKSRYVLEVNAGFVKANNIKIGDSVSFKLPQ
ncbi:MAG: DUF192 domain-containing protein [Candidatus Omnitrophota bacterium]